ncbi:MAG: amidohydrolase family protein [Deltaproteobacteria bacterium]|nr:amidohydrolase family protein [Deltaproteobacteria bacterium]
MDAFLSARFESTLGLAALPYFELREGRLRLADPALGPIFDAHTHLALTYGRRRSVDLRAATERTEHYLPVACPVDLDVYASRNFAPVDLRRMRRDLTLHSITRGGMRRSHSAPNLLREMAEMGVAGAALLPIDLPVLSHNAEAYLEVAASCAKLVAFGSVHPFARDPAARLEHQKAAGARGVKLHPAVQLVPPDHARALGVYRVCAELGLPVLLHCGPVGIEPRLGRYLSQVKHYWAAVRECPQTTFILAHAGALQVEMGIELCRRYPNVYLELASQSLGGVRRVLAEAPEGRVLFGSDWPFYHQAISLAKVLLATEGQPETRRRVLWENATRLLGVRAPP